MRVMPAVDLRDGACVQLVGGSYAEERVRIADPVAVTARWFDRGFDRIHVVDLDAATGRGENTDVVDALLRRWPERIQVGGGIRTTARARELLDKGALRAVVGTRALADRSWLARLASRFSGRVVVALDMHSGSAVVDGWQRRLPVSVGELLAEVDGLELGGLLVTAVHREGALQGPDVELMAGLRRQTRHPLTAAGGIRDVADVRALASVGVETCVVGMALYTGAFKVEELEA
ncbi:MAG: HisA/HisF-related TIM barrel protein [Mycobacteriales bacterium]